MLALVSRTPQGQLRRRRRLLLCLAGSKLRRGLLQALFGILYACSDDTVRR